MEGGLVSCLFEKASCKLELLGRSESPDKGVQEGFVPAAISGARVNSFITGRPWESRGEG